MTTAEIEINDKIFVVINKEEKTIQIENGFDENITLTFDELQELNVKIRPYIKYEIGF